MFELDIWITLGFIWKTILYISCFYAAGTILFFYFVKPVDASVVSRFIKSTLFPLFVALFFTLSLVPLQAGQLMDDGWAGMFDSEIIQIVSEGPTGLTVLIRSVGLGLLFYTAWRGLPFSFTGLLGSILVAASFTFTGHTTGEPRLILSILLTLHLLTTCYWFGALGPLHQMAGDLTKLDKAAHLSEKFGRQAAVAVSALLIAGVILAWLLVGTWSNLFLTPYGQILLAKVAVVGLLLLLAAKNKLSIVPAMLSGDANAATKLRLAIKFEAACFVLIFVSVAILTGGPDLPTP